MASKAVRDFFHNLPTKFDSEAAEGLSAVYQFELSGESGGEFYVAIENGVCRVGEGTHPDPEVTLSMTGEDCLGLLNGQLNGQSVFMAGRLRVTGDLSLAMQLKMLFPSAI